MIKGYTYAKNPLSYLLFLGDISSKRVIALYSPISYVRLNFTVSIHTKSPSSSGKYADDAKHGRNRRNVR